MSWLQLGSELDSGFLMSNIFLPFLFQVQASWGGTSFPFFNWRFKKIQSIQGLHFSLASVHPQWGLEQISTLCLQEGHSLEKGDKHERAVTTH